MCIRDSLIAMQFKDGTGVYSFEGQHVGHVGRVVLNPETKEVTDIVVRKGLLFTEDKIVPLSLIATATEDRVSLRENAGELDKLPPFEETHYIPVDAAEARSKTYPAGMDIALYWYPPVGGAAGYPGGLGYAYPPPYRIETKKNIPKGTIALK